MTEGAGVTDRGKPDFKTQNAFQKEVKLTFRNSDPFSMR